MTNISDELRIYIAPTILSFSLVTVGRKSQVILSNMQLTILILLQSKTYTPPPTKKKKKKKT
jgi:hypothetical protein